MASSVQGETLGGVSEAETTWPVEAQPVEGDRNTPMAYVEYGVWRAATFVLARLPRPLLNVFKGVMARLAKLVDKRHASSARAFVRQALACTGEPVTDDQVERFVTGAYAHLLEVAITPARSKARLGGGREALLERTEVVLSDDARRAMEAGGVVAVSSHVGDWETAAEIASAVGFKPFYAISKAPRNRPMSIKIQAMREERGIRVLPRRGAMAFAAKIIEAGCCMGMLLDQRARQKPVLAPLFGRPARSDRSAGVLLRRLKCPVVFMATYRTGDLRWRFVCERVIWPDEMAGASPEAIATTINAELEKQILAAPEQYFWLHDRYRDTPSTFPDPTCS